MDKTEISLHEYWVVLKRHRRLIFTVFLGTFLISAIFTFRSPNIYEAQTTFYYPLGSKGGSLDSVAQSIAGKEGSNSIVSAFLPSAGSEMQNYTKGILESRRVAEILNDRLNLTRRFHLNKKSSAIQMIRSSTQIKLTNEGIMQITVQTTDPKLSTDLANGYVDAFREFSLNSTLSQSKKHRIDVQDRIKQLKEKLHAAEAAMTAFQLKHQTADFTQDQKLMMQVIGDLRQQQFADHIAIQAALEGLSRVTALTDDQIHAASRDPLLSLSFADPILTGLRDQLGDVYVKYSQAKLTETSANPELRSYKAQLENIESTLRTQLRRLLLAQSHGVSDDLMPFRIKVAQLRARQDAVEVGIKRWGEKFKNVPSVGLEFMQIQRRLKILQTLDTFLATEYERARLDEARESPDFEVLDKAVLPDGKIGPHRLNNLSIGFFLGLFLGIAAAFLVESFKPRLLHVVEETDGRVEDYELALAEKPGTSGTTGTRSH